MSPSYLQSLLQSPTLFIGVCISALGGFLFGFDTGVINGVQITQGFLVEMGLNQLNAIEAANLVSWITSCLTLAAAFSSPFAGPLADWIGRKWTITIACIIVSAGAIIQAAAISSGMMIAGRVVVGIAIGLLSTCIPMFIAELSPKSIRGSLGTLFQLCVTLGILVAFLVNLGFAPGVDPLNPSITLVTSGWRYALGIQAALSIALFFAMMLIPESPRWLMMKGKSAKARAVLLRTRYVQVIGRRKALAPATAANSRSSTSEHDHSLQEQEKPQPQQQFFVWETLTNVDLELLDISDEIEYFHRTEGTVPAYAYWKLLHPSVLLRTTIGVALQFFQQLTGINAIFYYSSTVFQLLGQDPNLATAITGAVNVAATFIAVALMDRVGRRPLLLCGAAGMTVCLAAVGIILLCVNPAVNTSAGSAIVALICLFIVNFAYSWGPIGWILPSEMFPVNVRSKGIAFATMSNWLANFAIAKSVPSMILPSSFNIGGTFIFFAAWSCVMCVWVVSNVHETSGVTLEQMSKIFDVTTFGEYGTYMKHNIKYLFSHGCSMVEYTNAAYGRSQQDVVANQAETTVIQMENMHTAVTPATSGRTIAKDNSSNS